MEKELVQLYCFSKLKYNCPNDNYYCIKMGCHGSSQVLYANHLINIPHKLVQLVVTDQTEQLISFINIYNREIDINSAINFRGDTLLHYACFKNNLTKRGDILRTKQNYSKKMAVQLTTNQHIKKLCS